MTYVFLYDTTWYSYLPMIMYLCLLQTLKNFKNYFIVGAYTTTSTLTWPGNPKITLGTYTYHFIYSSRVRYCYIPKFVWTTHYDQILNKVYKILGLLRHTLSAICMQKTTSYIYHSQVTKISSFCHAHNYHFKLEVHIKPYQ